MYSIVLGSRGALGSHLIQAMKRWRPHEKIIGIDVVAQTDLDHSIPLLASSTPLQQQYQHICKQMESIPCHQSIQHIICVAGGFQMGNLKEELVCQQFDQMIQMNLYPSIIALKLAQTYFVDTNTHHLLLLTGAQGAYQKLTPQTLAYGTSKNAIHHLVQSIAEKESGFPHQMASCFAMLPNMLDTPSNRHAMPNANHKEWTNLNTLSKQIVEWMNHCDQTHTSPLATGTLQFV